MNDLDDDYEVIGRVVEAMYPGRCTIEYEHRIKRGDRVAKVQHSTNTALPVPGWACATCVKLYPRGKQ